MARRPCDGSRNDRSIDLPYISSRSSSELPAFTKKSVTRCAVYFRMQQTNTASLIRLQYGLLKEQATVLTCLLTGMFNKSACSKGDVSAAFDESNCYADSEEAKSRCRRPRQLSSSVQPSIYFQASRKGCRQTTDGITER